MVHGGGLEIPWMLETEYDTCIYDGKDGMNRERAKDQNELNKLSPEKV